MPADGALHQRNGQRISSHFFEGGPGVDGYKRDQQSFGYQFEHRFNDVFTARQNFRYLDSKVQLDQVYAYGWTTPTSNELNRYYSGGDEKLHAFIIDNMLQAEFFTGATKHTVLMGVDYQRRKTVVDWTSGSLQPINAFNPVYGNSAISYYGPTSYLRRLEQTGVYLQDLIEMDKWRFSLGLRQDWVETSDENRIAETSRPVGMQISDKRTKLTGRAGALYLFDNGLAPYVSYSESFNPNSYSDSAGNPLAPRWDAVGGGLEVPAARHGQSVYGVVVSHRPGKPGDQVTPGKLLSCCRSCSFTGGGTGSAYATDRQPQSLGQLYLY